MTLLAGRNYSNYRGRQSLGKVLLAVVLILVILAAAGFMVLQRYMVYDANGDLRLELPGRGSGSASSSATQVPDEDLNIIIDRKEPEVTMPEEPVEVTQPPVWGLLAAERPLTDWQSLRNRMDPEAALVCLTVKDEDGYVRVDSAVTAALSRGTVSVKKTTRDAIAQMTGEDGISTIARIVCLRDSRMPIVSVRGLGLRQGGGYLYYDGEGISWLDPAKSGVQDYLGGLARECAEMGFDEIQLAEVGYPTDGDLSLLKFTEAEKREGLAGFLEAVRTALEGYSVKLSLELPADVILSGANAVSGQALAELAPLVDVIYARTSAEEAPALEEAVKAAAPTTAFVAMVTDGMNMTVDYLLVES